MNSKTADLAEFSQTGAFTAFDMAEFRSWGKLGNLAWVPPVLCIKFD